MTILAAAADPHSWAKLMGYTEADANFTYLTDYTYPLFNIPPKVPKVDLTGKSEVFIKMFLPTGHRYTASPDASGGYGDHNSAFCIKNTDGHPIIGFGYNCGAGTLIISNSTMGVTLYDGTVNKVKVQNIQSGVHFPKLTRLGYTTTTCNSLYAHVKIDQSTPANSFVKLYINGSLVLSILGSDVHKATNMNIKELSIGEYITQSPSSNFVTGKISQLVVSDTPDFSLKTLPLKPSSLSTPNDFSGVIGNINGIYQDTNYLSTALETNAVCTIKLNPPTISGGTPYTANNSHTIETIDLYAMCRYMQTGGVSCNFSAALYDNTTKISDDVLFNIPANQDETKYLTDFIGRLVQNTVTLGKYSISNMTNLFVRITLVGV